MASNNPTAAQPSSCTVDVSVVVPMLNEEHNVAALCEELCALMDAQSLRYEVVIVNDGSDDGTRHELERAVGHDSRFLVVDFARNFGQSAALSAGFRHARGEVVVALDGDGQNDPRDIPKLVSRLHEAPGFDLVSGWRRNRQDKWLTRRLPSACANQLIRRSTGCRGIHDFGCTLKAYRREVIRDVRLYGEMHRFLPAICRWRGARMTEMVVNHRPRINGRTNYGLSRTFRVLLDLLTVRFLGGYLTKPIYFFGKLALLALGTAGLAVAVAIAQKFGYLTEQGDRVMLNNNIFVIFAMTMFLAMLMLLMMGLMSELLIRIYHESQDRSPYRILRTWRAGQSPGENADLGPEAELATSSRSLRT
jgi:glycosyltransferase involved in cell wall biosynthesis